MAGLVVVSSGLRVEWRRSASKGGRELRGGGKTNKKRRSSEEEYETGGIIFREYSNRKLKKKQRSINNYNALIKWHLRNLQFIFLSLITRRHHPSLSDAAVDSRFFVVSWHLFFSFIWCGEFNEKTFIRWRNQMLNSIALSRSIRLFFLGWGENRSEDKIWECKWINDSRGSCITIRLQDGERERGKYNKS